MPFQNIQDSQSVNEERVVGENNQKVEKKLGYRNHFPSHLTKVTCTYTHKNKYSKAICVRSQESNINEEQQKKRHVFKKEFIHILPVRIL